MKKIKFNYSVLTFLVAFVLTVVSSVYLYDEFYGHLYFWYESNYWEYTWSYFFSHLQDATLSQYFADFFLLGFKWRALAVGVFMLPVISVFLLSFRFIQKVELHSVWSIFAILPSAMLFMLQTHRLFFFFYSIYILIFYIVVWLYVSNRFRAMRYALTVIAYPLLYLFLPSGILFSLYVSLFLIEVLYFRKKEKEAWSGMLFAGFSVIALALCLFYPMIWNVLLLDEMATNKFMELGFLFDVKNQSLMMVLLFAVPILLLLLLNIKIKTKRTENFFAIAQCIVLVAFVVWSLPFKSYASFENYFRIEKAVFEQDWTEVIKLSENQKKKTNQLFPYTVLAHAAKGELPEKMFEYPLKLENVFLPVYDRKNITMQSNILFYSLCELYNMSIRCAVEDASIRLNCDDFFVLKKLAMLNAKKGNVEVAQKYINKLKLTLIHDDYIEKVEKVLSSCFAENTSKDGELYYMSDNKLTELYKFSEKYELTVAARDMLLCGILQKRDYETFASVFFEIFPYKTEKIPTAYEEFLLLAPRSGVELPYTDFVVSTPTQKRFDNFLQIYMSNNDPKLKKRLLQKHHGNTWWYYAVFGE